MATTPLIVWACIVGLFAIIIIACLCHAAAPHVRGGHHFIGFCSEREIFYVPGDPDPRNTAKDDTAEEP